MSTRADILQALGEPVGSGHALLAPSGRHLGLRGDQVGGSDRAAIVAALGQPSGKGTVQFPGDPKPRQLLSDYRDEDRVEPGGSGSAMRRGFMLVMLDGGVCDGHLG